MSDRVTIRSLHLYPVKGCTAVDVDAIALDARGLIVGDRQTMIVDAATGEFVSQRHEPSLARMQSRLAAHLLVLAWQTTMTVVNLQNEGPTRSVTVWDDTFDAIDLGDPIAASLSTFVDRPVRLVRLPTTATRVVDSYWAGDGVVTTFADLAPMLVTSSASLDDLNARRAGVGQASIEMARFRPNVVVDGLDAWGEDDVATLEGDGYSIALIKPCARCKVIELDPQTGDATGDEVFASLATFRALKNRRGTRGILFGQNAVVRLDSPTLPMLRTGDPLVVRRR